MPLAWVSAEAIVELSRGAQDGHERLSGIDGFLATLWYSEERPKLRIKHVAVSRWADEQMLLSLQCGDERLDHVEV